MHMKSVFQKGVFLGASLLYASFSYAAVAEGTAGSGGGNALICQSGTAAILYDFYEAEQLRQIQFDRALLGKDEYATALNVLERLKQVDPIRADRYIQHTKDFQKDASFLPNVNLPVIPDTGDLVIPIGCSLRQVVVQHEPQFPKDKRYLVDQTVWNVMPIRDRAGLILHEVVYREARALDQKDSIKSRYFNSMISSTAFQAAAVQGYHQLVGNASLRQFMIFDSGTRKLVFVGWAGEKFDESLNGWQRVRKFCEGQSMKAPYLGYDEPAGDEVIKDFIANFGPEFSIEVLGIWQDYGVDRWFPIVRHYDQSVWRQSDASKLNFVVCEAF